MTGFTYGVYLIYDTEAPTSGWVVSDHAAGTDYIKFSNKVSLNHGIVPKPGVIDLPTATSYAINLGEVSERVAVHDIMTRAEYDSLLKFIKTATQMPISSFLYLVICTADTPAVMAFYQKSAATASEYLPCVVIGMDGGWSEGGGGGQHWTVTIQVQAVW